MSKQDTYWNWDALMEAPISEVHDLIESMSESDLKIFMREYNEVNPRPRGSYQSAGQYGPSDETREKFGPRAPAEQNWVNKHSLEVFDNPEEGEYAAAKDLQQAPAPTAPNAPEKPEASPSFARIRQMMGPRT